MSNAALHYNDIALLPNYGVLASRKHADVSVNFLNRVWRLPVIPSNMKCVLDENRAKWLAENNYFYIMHRFETDTYKFVDRMQDNYVSISIGVNQEDKDLIDRILGIGLRVDCVTVDIAHGHSYLMEEMIEFLKEKRKTFGHFCIIAGNICTVDGYVFMKKLGVDAIKVGIGGGSVCSTKNKTGFTYPMYSCIRRIAENVATTTPIIADGGIREHGDIAKAIHAGASMVMIGGLFAKLVDSPAEIIDGHKIYFGSASQYNKGEYRNVEGFKSALELDPMTYEGKLLEMEQDLQSSVSYAGGKKLYDIRYVGAIQAKHWEVL